MTISIVVLTSNKELSRFVGMKKSSIVPIDIRKKCCFQNRSFAVTSVLVTTMNTAAAKVANYFLGILEGTDVVIVLCEQKLADLALPFSKSFFTYFFDSDLGGKTFQNYLGFVCARILRAFTVYSSRFDDMKYRRLMLLPLRNFEAPEIKNLEQLFIKGVSPDNLDGNLATVLAEIRQRQRPKRQSSYEYVYLVDEKGRYFIYGKEKHSQNETSCPPHESTCLTSAHFRFGNMIPLVTSM